MMSSRARMVLLTISAVITLLAVFPLGPPCLASGSIVAWGYNDYGQCNVPAPIPNVVPAAGGRWRCRE